MKKLALFFLLFASALASAQSANPFAGSHWRGRVMYRDADGKSHIDTYDLVLVANGTCIVTVTSRHNGRELFQDADGIWSFDERFFRLECDFPDAEIELLPYINWTSLYQFDVAQGRFTLLIKPYPEADFTVKTALVRVDD